MKSSNDFDIGEYRTNSNDYLYNFLLFVSVNEDSELVLEPLRQAAEELELLEVS